MRELLVRPADDKELLAEYKSVKIQFRVAAAVSVAVAVSGAVFYHFAIHLSWLNAFYFCVITLTTIGYGDIVPNTDISKLFTIFYVLAGIGVFAYFVNILVKNTVIRREMRMAKKIRTRETKTSKRSQ